MEEIFCKLIPFFFKPSDREERKSSVRVQMGFDGKSDSKKELVVKLTNDQDLYFLYTLHLAEEDFQSLKMQQGLLVDFTAFPQKLIDLLVMCLREDDKDNPKFVLQFNEGSSMVSPCTMNIVETNPFRHLNHLGLKFMPGSDLDVKTHLVTCLKQLKESYNVIQQKFEHTSQDLNTKLQEKEQTLGLKSSELDALKHEWSSRLSEVTTRHKEDMALEKEKAVQFQSSLQMRFESERREMEQNHNKVVRTLEGRLQEFDVGSKDLTDCKYRSEATIRELRGKLGVLEDENRRIKAELHTLRQDNSTLDTGRLEMDKAHNSMTTRVAVLEQELSDKVELLGQAGELCVGEKEKRKRAESEVDRRGKDVTKLEGKVKAMGEELKKGNEIIKKLQGDVKSYHAKVKLRTQIATEQEKLLGEKDLELEAARGELRGTKDRLREEEGKNEKLSNNLENAIQKLEESKKILNTNENMIQWLNKQINEQRVTQVHHGTFEMNSRDSKPGHGGMHNFSSASSHTSGPPHEASLRGRPAQQVHYQPQAEVHSGHAPPGPASSRQSHLPMPISPICSASMAIRAGEPTVSVAPIRNPPIDPKFLMRRDDAIPVRGALSSISSQQLQSNHNNHNSNHNNHNQPSHSTPVCSSLPSARSAPPMSSVTATSNHYPVTSSRDPALASRPLPSHLLPSAPVRLSQEMIVPRAQPPLASAYFPKS